MTRREFAQKMLAVLAVTTTAKLLPAESKTIAYLKFDKEAAAFEKYYMSSIDHGMYIDVTSLTVLGVETLSNGIVVTNVLREIRSSNRNHNVVGYIAGTIAGDLINHVSRSDNKASSKSA